MYVCILLGVLLIAIINAVDGYYNFYFHVYDKSCEAAKFTGNSFYVRYIYGIVYDTNTRLVAEKNTSTIIRTGWVAQRDTTDEKTPMPGTGNDFTSLWNGGPLMLIAHINDMKEDGTKKLLRQSKPQKCAETDKWFANEGFYKLEDDGSWIPVYYDPWETDFYY
ncbi:hypothetical protein GCK32_011648 [Trichostrongylus colubriformis]|uniref:Uncharacterized protein n=1 Tax=Trichostrongylus colubriformis TaxID=6319 RepID=A0AAN8GD25_TRICO